MTTSTEKMRVRALAVLSITIAVALSGCSLLGPGNDVAAGTDTDVFTIQVGDCLNDGHVTGEVSEVKVIDCGAEHDSEAYKSIKMTDVEFPGETAVDDMAISECTSAFTAFVGLDYNESSLDFSYYYPTESSWAQGDREILCLINDPEGKITGSLAGVAQ